MDDGHYPCCCIAIGNQVRMTAPRQNTLNAYQAALREASAAVASRDLQSAFRSNSQLSDVVLLRLEATAPALQRRGQAPEGQLREAS